MVVVLQIRRGRPVPVVLQRYERVRIEVEQRGERRSRRGTQYAGLAMTRSTTREAGTESVQDK